MISLSAFVEEAQAILGSGHDAGEEEHRTLRKLAMAGMTKTAGEFLPNAVTHGAELAGLGVLAKPSIQHLRGKQTTKSSDHAHEVAGLGILAAPSAIELGHQALPHIKRLLGRA